VEVGSELINRAMHDVVSTTIRMVQECLGDTAPDLSQDVSRQGIALVGGHAYLSDFAMMLAEHTGVEVTVAPQSDLVVINGLQYCMEEMSSLHGLFRNSYS
jgi:rod shape-determining protein MreB